MKIKKALLATTLAASAIVATSVNAETNFTPASFNFSGDDVANALALELPNTTNTAIYCQSDIAADGQNLFTQCFEKEGYDTLRKQVIYSISNLNFIPASINNEPVSVRKNYRVIVQQDDESRTVLLIPNLGSLQSQLGVNYVEPQEQIDSGWFNKVKSAFAKTNSFFSKNKTLTRAKATISTSGTSTKVELIDSADPKTSDTIKNALESATFIPGFVEGKATEMPYLAVITQ